MKPSHAEGVREGDSLPAGQAEILKEEAHFELRFTFCCRPRQIAPKVSPFAPTTGIAVREPQLSLR